MTDNHTKRNCLCLLLENFESLAFEEKYVKDFYISHERISQHVSQSNPPFSQSFHGTVYFCISVAGNYTYCLNDWEPKEERRFTNAFRRLTFHDITHLSMTSENGDSAYATVNYEDFGPLGSPNINMHTYFDVHGNLHVLITEHDTEALTRFIRLIEKDMCIRKKLPENQAYRNNIFSPQSESEDYDRKWYVRKFPAFEDSNAPENN